MITLWLVAVEWESYVHFVYCELLWFVGAVGGATCVWGRWGHRKSNGVAGIDVALNGGEVAHCSEVLGEQVRAFLAEVILEMEIMN